MNTESLLPAADHLAGFLIVMAALALLWGMTGLMGRWFERPDSMAAAANVARAPANDDLIVAAAAAAAMIDAPHRVLSVRREAPSPAREA